MYLNTVTIYNVKTITQANFKFLQSVIFRSSLFPSSSDECCIYLRLNDVIY